MSPPAAPGVVAQPLPHANVPVAAPQALPQPSPLAPDFQPGDKCKGKDVNDKQWDVTILRAMDADSFEVLVEDGFSSKWVIHKVHLAKVSAGAMPPQQEEPPARFGNRFGSRPLAEVPLDGTGIWQLSTDGDTETHLQLWKNIGQLDTFFADWQKTQDPLNKISLSIAPEEVPQKDPCRIDFADLVAEFDRPPRWMHVAQRSQEAMCVRPGCGRVAHGNVRGHFCGKGCQGKGAISLPLRRMVGGDARSHPPNHNPHPWYLKQVRQREEDPARAPVIVGGGPDWLSNEFFWQAFSNAYQIGTGKPPSFDRHELFDFRYNEDYRNLGREPIVDRRGGVLYKEPVGWKRFSINTRSKYPDTAWLNDWAVAYHGCPMKTVPLIMESAFRAGPLQGAKDCKDNRTDEKVGSGIYCSPNTIVNECYSNGEEGADKGRAATLRCPDGKPRTIFFALQCRVNPAAIRRPDRTFARCNDEEVMGVDGVFEWLINNPDDIRPYAVMVRDKDAQTLDGHSAEHRTLKDLVDNWNKEHKPLTPQDAGLRPDLLRPEDVARQIAVSRAKAEQSLGRAS